ncbi:phage terminase small subunit [Domibacillus sp.]|uniref:phage terminase small subunit n=1 Tax=Domibacillus sp. TaxID=1969783 RepID=UPI002810E4E8|nr:phage terminase small subunit [Domibacillus sp.]
MAKWDAIRSEWETTKVTLTALAEKHDIKLGTLKSRKSREGWSRDPTKKDATKSEKVATIKQKDATKKKHGGQPGNRGNPNPSTKFPKRNKAAEKHGLFSKFLPDETKEIMDAMTEMSAVDLIWQQIQIQFAAIIRSQQIMWVKDKAEMIKELKKIETHSSDSSTGEKQEWDFQFAWDRQATFLNAQSRAMAELRALIKQFDELAHIYDERRLKLKQMSLTLDKTKTEIDKLGKNMEERPIQIMIKRKGDQT